MFKKLFLRTDLTFILLAALFSALAMHIFVYPADFSPSGVDGIATMIQSKTGFSAGYTGLIVNVPLLLLAWKFLNRRYVIYALIYTVVSSFFIVLFKKINFYQYHTLNDKLIPAVFSGLILGVRTGIMIKIGSSTGGIDVVAAFIQKARPYKNIEYLISIISYSIIVAAFFVYNRNLESVMLTVTQIFVAQRVVAHILKSSRSAVEFKIITKEPDILKHDILKILKHSATIIDTKGMFSGEDYTMILCIVNTYQIAAFMDIVKSHPGTFAVFCDVNGVVGNFRWNKNEEPK